MGAAGVRGTLPERADGLEAAAKADVLYVRTTSEETEALEASEGRARRVRLGLEGGRRFDLENGGSVVPGGEVGVRRDAGDAETGFGVDAGAGALVLADPLLGCPGDGWWRGSAMDARDPVGPGRGARAAMPVGGWRPKRGTGSRCSAAGSPAPRTPGRDYRLGYRLDLVRGKALRFGVGIEGRFPDGAGRNGRTSPPDLRLTGALRW